MSTPTTLSGKMGTMNATTTGSEFGRVDDDGTVYLITSTGERMVGQVPDVSPEEALGFFTRRFQTLETEVKLLEDRVAAAALSPEEARKRIAAERTNVAEANAVGDMDSLTTRLSALEPKLAEQSEKRKAEKAQAAERARADKETMVAEAEKIAAGTDWRGGVNRFRALLDRWKALPRIDRSTDDELWHRFSNARTTYTRRRKAQFAEQAEKRESARRIKEKIITEAEPLASSTDWGATSGALRDLMSRWKAAGPAPREVDDKLWARFRGLQDTFFEARNAAQSELDAEFGENQQTKEALLDEAEASILPVTDYQQARAEFRTFLEKFNELGKVPRDAIRPLDNRVKALEKAVKAAEDEEWRRTDPEARKRAEDIVNTFSAQIDRLSKQADKAEAAGNTRKASEARETLETYRSWLQQAQKALDEFSG